MSTILSGIVVLRPGDLYIRLTEPDVACNRISVCRRFFCFVDNQRERYVLAATSVDVPDCPPNSDIIRGTVRF